MSNISKVEWIEKGAAANLKPAKVRSIFKTNLLELGAKWYNEYFKRFKFGSSAQNKYHLQQRKPKYIAEAKVKYGTWAPFVASGELKKAALSGANIKADAKAEKLDVTVKVKRGHPTKKWVSLELIKVLKQEIDEMMTKLKDGLMKGLTK